MADDINEAILDLAQRRRLSAVSCMVALPGFRTSDLHALASIEPRIEMGLHLVLTSGDTPAREDNVQPTFRELLKKSLLGQIDEDAMAREVEAQYRRFEKVAGRPPDFVDGHLHVHQFPVVRNAVVRFLQQIDADRRPYVRNSAMPMAKIWQQRVSRAKCFALGWFGDAFQRAACAAGLRTNRGFAGVYDYRTYEVYPEYLRRFVDHMEDDTSILMTHPGTREPWRRAEYETLRETPLLAGKVNRFTR
ncbi:MAG TPA: ChbG/HpnK family deacetylase [Chthoniobacter sp.]|nr:ChbG/HpnK family deacetylase [Chthoniobacter sp.]